MAIALVSQGALASAAAAAVTPAFGQATASGNLLVARVGAIGAAVIATTATGWVSAIQKNSGPGPAAVFYKANCGAGEAAPAFTSSAATQMWAVVSEYSGAHASAPLDQTGDSGFSTIATTPGVVTAAAADSSDSNVALACTTWSGSKSATMTFTDTWTPAGGTASILSDGATKAIPHFAASAYLLNTHGGAVADSLSQAWTASTGTENGSGAIATFKPAPVVAPRGQGPKTTGSLLGPGAALQAVHRASRW